MNEQQAQMVRQVRGLRKFDRAVILALEAYPGATVPDLMLFTGYPEVTVGRSLAMLLEVEWVLRSGSGFHVRVPVLDVDDPRAHLRRVGARFIKAQRQPVDISFVEW